MEILRYVLLSNALLVVVSTGYYLLLRRQTFFTANRLALWVGLAAALILPLLKLPDWRPQTVRVAMERTAQIIVPTVLPKTYYDNLSITITLPNQKTYQLRRSQSPNPDWTWQQGFITVYLLGVLALLIRLGIQLRSLYRLIHRSTHETYDDFMLVHNSRVNSPFSFFSWTVLNVDQHTPDELEQILRHERVHVRERHSLDMLGAELVCIAFWFNPAAYLFRYLLQQTLEFSVDRAVLAEGVDAKAYQYSLVKVSLLASQSGITSYFSGPTLKQRIGMINSPESTSLTCWRYAIWGLQLVAMGVACRHDKHPNQFIYRADYADVNNSTQEMMLSLENQGNWYRHLALLNYRSGTSTNKETSAIIQLNNNKLHLSEDHVYESSLLINGQEAPLGALESLSPERISDLVIMHQIEDLTNADTQTKPYQILIQTSSVTIPQTDERRDFFTFLEAASQSKFPLGKTFSFNMNQLLEATFFHNKNALVERTPNEHLRIYDEYAKITDIFIDGAPATVADVAALHVREIAQLLTRERPYTDWFRSEVPRSRFELLIQTAPERAQRDSSYYVFSPFYTGDF